MDPLFLVTPEQLELVIRLAGFCFAIAGVLAVAVVYVTTR